MRGLGAALDWACPPACALCGEPAATLCDRCRDDARSRIAPCCRRCAVPLETASPLCGRCLRRSPAFDATLAAALYEAPFDQLIRGLKYGATLAYVPLLSDLLQARFTNARDNGLPALDCIVPIPLSRDRMASRGFNQSGEIARRFATAIGCSLDTSSVLRIVDTPPQASLPFDARRRNLRGAFALVDAHRDRFRGCRIGVVDDVMTTGATLDEFARTLKRAGAATVINLVVARTP